jgi:hypothetical protein
MTNKVCALFLRAVEPEPRNIRVRPRDKQPGDTGADGLTRVDRSQMTRWLLECKVWLVVLTYSRAEYGAHAS